MKKLCAIFMCLVMVLSIVPAFAATAEAEFYYVMDMDAMEGAFGSEDYFVKAMNVSGEVQILPIREKRVDFFMMDDAHYNISAEEAFNYLEWNYTSEGLMTKMELADGEIKAIYLAGSEGFEENVMYRNNYSEDAYYDAAAMKYGDIQLDENTVVFVFDSTEQDDDAFSVRGLAEVFEDECNYSLMAYGAENEAAEAVVVLDWKVRINPKAPVMVVTRISNVVYGDETTAKFTGIVAGEEKSFVADPEIWYDQFEEGNIIMYRELDSLAVDVQMLMESSRWSGVGALFPIDGIEIYPTEEMVNTACGVVTEKTSTYFTIDDGEEKYEPSGDGCNYTVVEYGDEYECFNVTRGSFDDVVAYSEDDFVEVFVKTTKDKTDVVTDVVIFKCVEKTEEELPSDEEEESGFWWEDRVAEVNTSEEYINCIHELIYFADYDAVTLLKNGEEIQLDEVLKDDVVTVCHNEDNTLTVHVSSEKVTGVIEEVYEGEYGAEYVINGKSYLQSLWTEYWFEPGEKGVFYINTYGQVADVEAITNFNSSEYVYVTGADCVEGDFAEDEVILKVLGASGEEEILTVQNEVMVGDRWGWYEEYENYVVYDMVYDYIWDGYGTVARIAKNELGEISEIYFPNYSDEFIENDYYIEDMEQKAKYYNANRSAYGIIDIDSETMLYSVDTEEESVELYSAQEFLEDGRSYNIIAYGAEDEAADVLVVLDAESYFDAEKPVMVVTKVTEYIMNDEVTYKITGIEAGVEKSVIVDPDEDFPAYDIVPGGIITYAEEEGIAQDIYLLYYTDVYGSDSWGWGYAPEEMLVEEIDDEMVSLHHGELTEVSDGSFVMNGSVEFYPAEDCNYTVISYSAAGMSIKAATKSDLAVSEVRTVYVFAKTAADSADEVIDVVIYKNADNAQVDENYEYELESEYAPDYVPPAEPEYVLLVDMDRANGDFGETTVYTLKVMTTDGEMKEYNIKKRNVTVNDESGLTARDAFDYIESEYYYDYNVIKIALSSQGEVSEVCLADFDESFYSYECLYDVDDWKYDAESMTYGDVVFDEETVVFMKDWNYDERDEGLTASSVKAALKDSWNYEFISYGKDGEAADVLVVLREDADESVPHIYAEATLDGNSARVYVETYSIDPDAKVIVKLTDEEGYTTVKAYPVPEEGWFEEQIDGDFVEAKVLAWSALDTMVPLCEAETTIVD